MMMASGEIRLSTTTMRRMPVLAQSQDQTQSTGTAQSQGSPQSALPCPDPCLDPVTVTSAAYQGAYHDQLVAQITSGMLGAGVQVVNGPTICLTGASPCARPDIFARDPVSGGLMIIEVKTGENPSFTPGQILVYSHLDSPGSLYSASPQLSAFGISPGQSLPPIFGVVWYQPNATTPQTIIPMGAFFP
jgi:hypothetical protein